MLKVIFKDQSEKEATHVSENGMSGKLDGENYKWDIVQIAEREWSVIDEKGHSFQITLISEETGRYHLKIDGESIEVSTQSEFDLLLKKLGISAGGNKKASDVKAPMPGLVLDVLVNEGDSVVEGDVLLVLEAMKMENVIKSTVTTTIKSIAVNKGETIDKGEVMITFE